MPDMLCPRCGKENPQGADFCLSCGAVLSQSQPLTQPQDQQGERRPHSMLCTASLVLGLLSIVALLVIGFLTAKAFLRGDSGLEPLSWADNEVLHVAQKTCLPLAVAGFVLGIIGLIRGGRRLSVILGIVFSVIPVALYAALRWVF